ncbi:MAG TPA: ABC-2 family transporter protein, partial [bacterium]|nr:ABC-2 family transporter protein [bacterium]
MRAGVYWATFKASLQAKLEYKLDFAIGLLTSTMLQLAALGFLWVVFHQASHLQGWDQAQVVFLFGLTATALGLSELFFNHIWMLPYYIVMGDLDRLMVYPVRSLPFLLISRPELHSFGNLATGLVLCGASLGHLHRPWFDYALVPLWAACGSLIYTSALVAFSSLSFRFVGPFSYSLMIPHALLQASRYPLNIYPGALHYGLLVLVPFGAFNYLPGGWV